MRVEAAESAMGQRILKSMHECRSCGLDRSERTHTHLIKTVTAMSHFTASGLDKKH